jgi:hypothetical protein
MALNGNVPTTGKTVNKASTGKSAVEQRLDAELARRGQELKERDEE